MRTNYLDINKAGRKSEGKPPFKSQMRDKEDSIENSAYIFGL